MSAEFDPIKTAHIVQAQSSEPELSDDDLMWELLSLYADGEAAPEEAAQVEQMLRSDAEYARAYSLMKHAGSAIRTIVEIEPPAFLQDVILAKTSHRPTFARRLSAALATLRTQLALPPVGRLALAGGSLAATALVVGVLTSRPANTNSTTQQIASIDSPFKPVVAPKLIAPVEPEAPRYSVPNPFEAAVVQVQTGATELKPANAPPDHAPQIKIVPPTVGPTGTKALVQVPQKPTLNPHLPPANFSLKQRDKGTFAGTKPPQQPSGKVEHPYSGVDTQNVDPMMDEKLQHHPQLAMVSNTPVDLGQDVETGQDSPKTPTVAPPTGAEGDSTPAARRKLVGMLRLSSLPPASRHILTSADIKNRLDAQAMSYSATAMEGMQRRDADVPVIAAKF